MATRVQCSLPWPSFSSFIVYSVAPLLVVLLLTLEVSLQLLDTFVLFECMFFMESRCSASRLLSKMIPFSSSSLFTESVTLILLSPSVQLETWETKWKVDYAFPGNKEQHAHWRRKGKRFYRQKDFWFQNIARKSSCRSVTVNCNQRIQTRLFL